MKGILLFQVELRYLFIFKDACRSYRWITKSDIEALLCNGNNSNDKHEQLLSVELFVVNI